MAVEHPVDLGPGRVGTRLGAERPPVGVDPADQVDAAVLGSFLKKLINSSPCSGVQGRSREAQAPEQHHGLALVVQVARILAELDLVAEELPVVHDQRRRRPSRPIERSSIIAQTRPSRWHPSRTLASTVLTWRARAGLTVSPMKRLRKTPSMPYSRIHLQCTAPALANAAVEPGRRAVGHFEARDLAEVLRGS